MPAAMTWFTNSFGEGVEGTFDKVLEKVDKDPSMNVRRYLCSQLGIGFCFYFGSFCFCFGSFCSRKGVYLTGIVNSICEQDDNFAFCFAVGKHVGRVRDAESNGSPVLDSEIGCQFNLVQRAREHIVIEGERALIEGFGSENYQPQLVVLPLSNKITDHLL